MFRNKREPRRRRYPQDEYQLFATYLRRSRRRKQKDVIDVDELHKDSKIRNFLYRICYLLNFVNMVLQFVLIPGCALVQSSTNEEVVSTFSAMETMDVIVEVESTTEATTEGSTVESTIVETQTETENVVDVINDHIGDSQINVDGVTLTRFSTPDRYYPGLDYSSFQPFMGWDDITNKSTKAYALVNSDRMYSDSNGLCRFYTTDSDFTINRHDDYVVALGTYYKPKGEVGSRYLIITSTGMYTVITGDEKADKDTDDMNMYSYHEGRAGLIEWIVDYSCLHPNILHSGSITSAPVKELQGEIKYIYKISE